MYASVAGRLLLYPVEIMGRLNVLLLQTEFCFKEGGVTGLLRSVFG
jgi:hypothetical protein